MSNAVSGWKILIVRQGGGWTFCGAEESLRGGAVRCLPPLRLRQLLHSSPEAAIQVGVAWLRKEGFVKA